MSKKCPLTKTQCYSFKCHGGKVCTKKPPYTVWFIENDTPFGMPRWYKMGLYSGPLPDPDINRNWTDDPNEAIFYSNKEEAQKHIDKFNGLSGFPRERLKVTEHIFDSPM